MLMPMLMLKLMPAPKETLDARTMAPKKCFSSLYLCVSGSRLSLLPTIRLPSFAS